MALYLNQNNKLKEVEEKSFKLEREMQKVFEENLNTVMGLELVKSECTIKNRRIDTLAFDKQSSAFIIIEYKRDKSLSVVDQGFTYLSLMLENKADFIVEYNECLGGKLKREDVDWSQTRVAFVSTSFTDNQIQATNFKDIAIELWEVKRYENNTISISQIKKSRSAESIKPLTQQNQSLKTIADEIKVYTEEDNLKNGSEQTVELYEKFKNAILNLADGIEIKQLKNYIAFKKDKNVVGIIVQRSALKLIVNAKHGTLKDARNVATDVSNVGHWGTGDYQIKVEDDKDIEYIMSLIKQAI